ncbi:transcriptional regulator [Desulfocucumis palustris]|uniref:Transcriptional regulator n=1 Tax=Desulfocucumis palustris TaxID=1898651 RepID=A0A2L2XEX1_9FIRM|nr:helix-turn-helix domain-containing protein [Desulfocucumis palustris]GBF34710.1 transcriptional regulator [Desulfocucumis palustris]
MNDCPVKYALNILNGKWKLQIVWELNQQEKIRFNELQRRLKGISSFMLSKNLDELEQYRIIVRKQYNEVPPRVEYSLTELGKAIHPSLEMLGAWGIRAFNEMQNQRPS